MDYKKKLKQRLYMNLGWAFSFSLFIAGDLVIILSLLGKHELAQLFAWFLCGMTVLYWIFWNILRKKY